EALRHRFEFIDPFQRQKTADGLWFNRMVRGLVMVEVTIFRRRHHDIVPARGGFRTPADPIHERRARGEAALANLAPADKTFAVSVDDSLNAMDEIRLQLASVL